MTRAEMNACALRWREAKQVAIAENGTTITIAATIMPGAGFALRGDLTRPGGAVLCYVALAPFSRGNYRAFRSEPVAR